MASEWPRVAVAEVCDVFLGGTPRRSDPAYWSGPIKWASAKDVAGCSSRYLTSTEETITPRGIEESAAKLLGKDTVVITARGTVGALCMLGEPMSFNQTCYGLIGKKDKTIQPYLYYALKAALSQVHSLSYGTVFDTITMKTFEDILIFLPSLGEQRRIAHILGTLDDKIELNRRMNRTLEKMAQAIFKSWFIDFDPVIDNALRAGKPIPDEFAERAEQRQVLLDQNQPSPPPPLPEGEGGDADSHYRGGYNIAGLKERARELREKQTPAEEMMWELLRGRRFLGLKFRRQHQIGDYIADFYCHEYRLVIELDGGIHRQKEKKDHKRDAWLNSKGYTVLRFKNDEVLDAPETVLARIETEIGPSPSGRGGGEGSMDAIHRLFPDSFEDSEIGEIPKGWEPGVLGDIADNAHRSVKPDEVPATTPYIGLQHMPRRCIALDTWGRADEVGSQKSRFKEGEILFGKLRPYFHKVGIAPVNGVCSTDILVVLPKAECWHSYVLSLVSSKTFVDYTDSHSAGTKMPRTNWKDMSRYPLALPPVELASAFQNHVAALHQRIAVSVRQNRRLARLRDTLLPKLLSGELEVPDAVKVLEDAV